VNIEDKLELVKKTATSLLALKRGCLCVFMSSRFFFGGAAAMGFNTTAITNIEGVSKESEEAG